MNEQLKDQVRKQLKLTSGAVDLIKISQRTQHTSIKEALKKMLRSISILAEIEINKKDPEEHKKSVNKDLTRKTIKGEGK